MQDKFNPSQDKVHQDKQMDFLYCVECGYMHPEDAGLEEGDLCPDCGQGILVKI